MNDSWKTNLKFLRFIMTYAMITAVPLAFAGEQKQEFTFKYKYKQDQLKITTSSNDWKSAYELASQECFNKLTRKHKLTESIGMDIIDVCANPR